MNFSFLWKEKDQNVIFLWVRVFLWCGLIFFFSSMPNYEGKEPNFETLLRIADFFSRKTAHLAEYAILMVFTYTAFKKTWYQFQKAVFLLSFILVLFYAVSDEWHQTFVFGRSGTVMDVFIDSVGALIGFILYRNYHEKKTDIVSA